MECGNHLSIRKIKQNLNITCKYLFQFVSINDVKKVKDLQITNSVVGDILTNILTECEFTFSVLALCINKSFETGAFSHCLK